VRLHLQLHVGVAGLPGLEVQVDLHARLLLAQCGRNAHDHGRVILRLRLTIGSAKELEELLPCFWSHFNPHPQYLSQWSIS